MEDSGVCALGSEEYMADFTLQLAVDESRPRDKEDYVRVFFFFPFIFISWRLITLQYCTGFCHT